MRLRRAAAALLLASAGSSCGKVPLYDVYAGFLLADASWFAEEETLFVFYDVRAEQGLGEPSVIEIAFRTDDEVVNWTPLEDFEPVHTHLEVDCGLQALCGSASIHVPKQPRGVQIRLRYHRDGALALDANTVYNVVGAGDPWDHRSLIVYGVFDESNALVQWRARHQFPTLRNEQAEAYGLRRDFLVRDQTTGTQKLDTNANPYGYGARCPSSFSITELEDVQTNERAVFNPEELPVGAGDDAVVCAEAVVTDATGFFETGAIARKNPEVRPAFPLLRSPIRDATPVPFYLEPCDRVISADHEAMQRQRLLEEGLSSFCIDDWQGPEFVDELVVAFTNAVEAERVEGNDMVLVIGLNRDEDGVADAVEEALAQIVPEERHRSSPRLAGAFVFDSDIRTIDLPELEPVTLWCPASLPSGFDIPDASQMSCAIAPDNPNFELGPFSFGSLPILPSRDQYLDFIDTYSKAQAGDVLSRQLLVPEFAATSDHVDLGEFGVVTFLNNEVITAAPDDAFSYCVDADPGLVVFRSEYMQSDAFQQLIAQECAAGNLPEDFCYQVSLGLLPLSWLGEWHSLFGEDTYELGIYWEFPFLLQMTYELITAGSVGAFGFSVPFGFRATGEAYLGTAQWTVDQLSLEDSLTQCSRYCEHPTFDSAGVYHVADDFRDTYATSCYLPLYPAPGDSGFPLDP